MDCRKAREKLPGLMDGTLSPSQRASLLKHLGQCPGCREEWQLLKSVVRMVRSLPEVDPPSDFRVKLMKRLQSEQLETVVSSRRVTGPRWYQWSVAAAAVLTLLWSARFATVKPSVQRPTDSTATTAATEITQSGDQARKVAPEPARVANDASEREHDDPLQETPSMTVAINAIEVAQSQQTTADLAKTAGIDRAYAVTGSVSLTASPAAASIASVPPVRSQAEATVTPPKPGVENPSATAQTTSDPSFGTSRQEIAGDRHREDSVYSVADNNSSAGFGPGTNVRLEEHVTRFRIGAPSPDELRQRLKQLTQGDKLAVVEINPRARTIQFSVRGTTEQINRLINQVGALATVLERETMIVNLAPEWTMLQGLVAQTRLEIARREVLLRQVEPQAQMEQQEAALVKARAQLQNHQKALRLLESRCGTAVLEIEY